MATSPSTQSVQAPVITWSPNHIVIEPSYENEISWAGTPYGNAVQPGGEGVRVIAPAPGSLYGNAVGKTMVLPTFGVPEPFFPPMQEIYERPTFVPGVGWVNSNTPTANG